MRHSVQEQGAGSREQDPIAFICVNGILSNPGEAEGWTDRAVTWLNLHTEGKAEKFEYFTSALTRRIRQQWRAEAIARMARFYLLAGYEVSFIGHSNGCDLIERVLELLPLPVRSVHFFAAAADGEILARALERGHVGRAFLYGSDNDRALNAAIISRALFGCIGLGYGSLGLRGEEFAGYYANVTAHEDDEQTHSSWFERGHEFEKTMRLIEQHESQVPRTTQPTVTST